jgi:peptidoglycan L-alanyl-D-glutamate endopeptidase CwlK
MTKDINDLLPIVKKMAAEFQSKAKLAGIDFVVTSVYRSIEEQNAIYAQGRTVPGAIVTNAKGGQSFHNWKVAFDIVPVIAGKAIWNDDALWSKLGQIGTSVGLEWGGSWQNFKDLPHFQFVAGYSFQDFIDKKVDYKKFDVAVQPIVDTVQPLVDKLNSAVAAKNYKLAKDTCSYLFTELAKKV